MLNLFFFKGNYQKKEGIPWTISLTRLRQRVFITRFPQKGFDHVKAQLLILSRKLCWAMSPLFLSSLQRYCYFYSLSLISSTTKTTFFPQHSWKIFYQYKDIIALYQKIGFKRHLVNHASICSFLIFFLSFHLYFKLTDAKIKTAMFHKNVLMKRNQSIIIYRALAIIQLSRGAKRVIVTAHFVFSKIKLCF